MDRHFVSLLFFYMATCRTLTLKAFLRLDVHVQFVSVDPLGRFRVFT